MSGFLLHVGATVLCMHAGHAQPIVSNPRVRVEGQAITTQPNPYTVAGCALPSPPGANGPCATAEWITAATRVRAGGVPVLLQDSQAICSPSGTGLNVVVTQARARGT